MNRLTNRIFFRSAIRRWIPVFFLCMAAVTKLQATKLVVVKVVDRDYLMISFKDGDVEFVDDGEGEYAYTSTHQTDNNYVVRYGDALDAGSATNISSWVLKSTDDPNYAGEGLNPVSCSRKSKLNGLAEMDWNSSEDDWNYEYTMEHHIFLELPHSMTQGKSYTLEISGSTNSDVNSRSFTYDIFSSRTEAIHTNLVGYSTRSSIKAADLYMWMGDGGARDYSAFEGNNVFIYDVETGQSFEVGTVKYHAEKAAEASGHVLIQSDVWTADFTMFNAPGTFRIAIEGVGCSEDFRIAPDIFFEPFRVSTRGYFYMRIGQDHPEMTPVPRRPLYIPGESPPGTRVIITDFSPYHPDWDSYSGDQWDQPGTFSNYVKSGSPENPGAYGGWSDAFDWDRHLEHTINIYDMLLPYLLTGGNLPSDDLGIAESGNGIPDVLDEALMEVDFWLRLRYGKGYSHGVTCPDNNTFYQADNTPMGAWANAANAAMLSEAFRISGHSALMEEYRDSAIVAYNYAETLSNQMLDSSFTAGLRGRDLKMTAAAFLYNVTGDTEYENVIHEESLVTGPTSDFIRKDLYNQLYAMAAYLHTPRTVNYPDLRENMIAAAVHQARLREAGYSQTRPSRRSADGDYGWFHTEQQVQRTILAHSVATDPEDKSFLEDALILEADWSLGRNSANLVQMTTATTALDTLRSIQQCYTSGWDDGSPGVHPGHTPYMNIYDWGSGMIMSRPSWMTDKGYPAISEWPKSEAYFDVRYVYAHCEFTPAQTMRGKQALYGYLTSIGESSGEEVPVTGVTFTESEVTVEGSEDLALDVTIEPENATNTYLFWESADEEIVRVDPGGIITGVAEGTAEITVTTYDGGYTDVCEVTVNNVAVTGIELDSTEILLLEGDSAILEPGILPVNALNRNVTWESTDPMVAKVNADGIVHAISEGSAIVTVTTLDGGFSATCEVTVDPLPDQLVIYRDEINRMDFTWTDNGTLTELNKGGYEGMNHYEFDYELVNWWAGMGFGFSDPLDVSGFRDMIIGINGPLDPGHFIYVVLTDEEKETSEHINLTRTGYYMTYRLSLEEIALTSALDLTRLSEVMLGLKGAQSGTGAFYIDDIYFSAGTSDIPVEDIEVIPSEITLNSGESEQVSAVVTPSSATNKSVTWTSSDPDIATVSASGIAEGISAGSTHIIATTMDGEFSDSMSITVIVPYIPVTGVTVSPASAIIEVGETIPVSATVEPEDAADPSVSWTSDDISIASVDGDGQVTGKAPGETTITVTTEDGGFSAGSEITVIKKTAMYPYHFPGDIQFYPNPLRSDQNELTVTGITKGSFRMIICDITGRTVYKDRIETALKEVTFSPGPLKTGLYFISLQNNNRKARGKLVVR